MTALGPFRSRLAGKLSGGMKQKLALACALVRVSRGDPAEKLLVETLLSSEPDLHGRDEPMAFPGLCRRASPIRSF